MIFLDSETIGLVGPMVLLQTARDDEPARLHHVWDEPVGATLELLESLTTDAVCGFNLTFDWFHIQRTHNILRLMQDKSKPPIPQEWVALSRRAVNGPCLKPPAAMDVMLHARKGPMQSLMERDDVRIRRVPKQIAYGLAERLTNELEIESIYFARRKAGYQWQVVESEERPDFPDVVLRFAASGGLKPLGRFLLNHQGGDFPIPKEYRPRGELQWNIHDTAWRTIFHYHCAFWATNRVARQYAADDIKLTRDLWKHFGSPPPGDTNSNLACLVGSARWRGYNINRRLLSELAAEANVKKNAAPRDWRLVLRGLHERMTEMEAATITDTGASTLDVIIKVGGPAARFAQEVKDARASSTLHQNLHKILANDRLHFDMKVTGTLSDRTSGASGFSIHGIERDGDIRKGLVLPTPRTSGGDFEGYEVSIADAVYNDPQLNADIRSGRKLHTVLGTMLYDEDYDTVKGSPEVRVQGKGWDGDLYNPAKHSVFAWIYGAEAPKIAETARIEQEDAERAIAQLYERYPRLSQGRRRIFDRFCSMRQPGGLGSRVEWHEPDDYIESLFGFRRYFTLENKICKFLFDLAHDPPDEWKSLKGKVQRREGRFQTQGGAAMSALYGAAFQMQARNMRCAANHEIQSTGAHITKEVQHAIWKLQPTGVHEWVVQPFNMHDEVVVSHSIDVVDAVRETEAEFKKVVPLLSLAWKTDVRNWKEIK